MSTRGGAVWRSTGVKQLAAAATPVLAAAALAAGCADTQQRRPLAAIRPAADSSATVVPSAPSATAASLPATTGTMPPHARPIAKPPIVWDPIPFGPARKQQMLAYAQRHYGLDTYRLVDPHVIVIHYTESPDFRSTYNTFAPDVPDSELHELPNTCAHYVIDRDGTIHQLVPLDIMCRHTVGLNWTAIGIEHVGYSDAEVLGDARQMRASLRLVRWLRCTHHIAIADVIGHNESLSSPYHHERVPAWRAQTHSDFNHASMRIYRSRLRAAGAC